MRRDPVIYVIDDEPDVCRSLAGLLSTADLATTVFASAEDLLQALRTLPPGVVISDVRMPGMTGIELIDAIRARDRGDPVIIITGHADLPLAVQALRAGASDFIEKPFDAAAIFGAIKKAASPSGENGSTVSIGERVASLTPREREVLSGLVAGSSNKEIAIGLGISPRTVEVYRTNVMTKMDVRNLSQLISVGVVALVG